MTLNRLKIIIILLVGLVFLFFAYLQINDPDSLIWIIAYLIPAALSFSTLTNYRSKYIRYISPIYLIVAIYLYLYNSETTVMHVFDETTNESLGLVLCSIWIFILPWLNKKISIEKVVKNSQLTNHFIFYVV